MIRNITTLAMVLVMMGCSNGSKIEAVDTSAKAVTVDTPAPSPIGARTPMSVVGNFRNVKSDGEHEWGYSVALWRTGNEIVGFVSGADSLRLIGDSPTGLLENVTFDPATNRLSFTAKLSVGITDSGNWSRNLYEFDGILKKKVLEGTLRTSDDSCGSACSKSRKVRPRFHKGMTQVMSEFENYEEFKARADEILKRRGPKW
jgi:hypothetical protein